MSLGPIEILLAVVGLSILVIVHESGHYLAARAFGMKVLRYSIGFGPTLFKHKPKGSDTTFQIAAIPFLAYVQIAGMNPYEENEPDEEGLFNDASTFARIVTVAAGPFANYLTAALVALAIGLVGWPASTFQAIAPEDGRGQLEAVVGAVGEDSPASAAGIREGDEIVQVAGVDVDSFRALKEQTEAHGGEATEFVLLRDGERMSVSITPEMVEGHPRIGIAAAEPDPVQLGFGEAAEMAVVVPWKLTVFQLKAIGNMISSLDSSGVGGPVRIAEEFGKAAKVGPTAYFVMLMMMSVALGLFNLLPFPALDGGRLAFLAFEAITRKKPNERFEAMVHTVGILILLVVIALVTVRDIGGGDDESAAPATSSEESEEPSEEAAPTEEATPAEEATPTEEAATDEAPSAETPANEESDEAPATP